MTKAERVIAFCREQVGKPYVFATSGPNSFDCSGLTKRAAALPEEEEDESLPVTE